MDTRVLEQTFALFDKNNSKRISVRDLGDFLRLMVCVEFVHIPKLD